jgi:hypothetical protein
MKKLKNVLLHSPEYYLLILVLLSGFKPPFHFATPVLIGAGIVVLQIIFRNRIAGLVISGLLVAGSVLMLMAALSEFGEFSSFDGRALQLILGVGTIFLANLLAAGLMIYKYQFASKSQEPEFIC